MRFWDSSAIVPMLAPQRVTPIVESLLDSDPHMLVWWTTPVECVSALTRLEREGGLSAQDVSMSLARLRALVEAWNEIQPHPKVRATAERLLRVHPLRAADALQLAAALEVADVVPSSMEFVCLDRRLGNAAAREGLMVIDGDKPLARA